MKLKDICFWKKSYDKSKQHIEKHRYHFGNKSPYIQSYGFSSSHVEMWELDYKEGWVLKKMYAFELWCWRRHLRVPCTAERSKQSILKEIDTEYSLEGLILKLQCFGRLIWRADSLEKTLMLGKTGGKIRGGRAEDEIVS